MMKNQKTMSRFVLAPLCLVLAAAGCSVEGKWSVAEVDPTAARRDFPFESLTLQDDGTFYAEAKTGAGVETMSGQYSHDNKTLTLRPHDKDPIAYDTRFLTADRIELSGHWEGRKLVAEMERRSD